MREPDSTFENELPSHRATTAVARVIRAIIGGLLGAVSGGLGGAVGATVVLAVAIAREGWNGWAPLFLVSTSFIPALGGFVGGTIIGTTRAGRLVLGVTVGGVLGAWLQIAVGMLLSYFAEDHDLIGYPRAIVYVLFILSGGLPPILGSILGSRISRARLF